MRCSEQLIEQLKQWEGLRLDAYKCPGGVWTIGYGHTAGVTPTMHITENQATLFLAEDLEMFETYVNTNYPDIPQNQFDALVSIIYNIGVGRYINSSLKRKIDNHAPMEEVKKQWLRWVHAGGKVLPGLVKRREWEFQLYSS